MKKITIIGIIIVLGIAYYGISPLFNNIEVNDELPEQAVKTPEESIMESGGGFENLSEENKVLMEEQMEELNSNKPVAMNDSLTELSIELTEDVEKTTPTEPETPETFEIMSTAGHPASGIVRAIETEEGTVVRFENFKTINGPRLHLYLAKDINATEFIDLGPIRGTEGNINYTVPEGIDISEYPIVMHWCVPFGVLFNFADLGT